MLFDEMMSKKQHAEKSWKQLNRKWLCAQASGAERRKKIGTGDWWKLVQVCPPKTTDIEDKMELIKDGLVQVGKGIYPYDEKMELETKKWMRTHQVFTNKEFEFNLDEFKKITSDKKFWKHPKDKAVGPSCWTEEMLKYLDELNEQSRADLELLLKLRVKFETFRKWSEQSYVIATPKPNKAGDHHNHYRKLRMMCTVKKMVDRYCQHKFDLEWQCGSYQSGFCKKKSTMGRIFIVTTILWDVQNSNDRSAQLGVALIDFSMYFDTLRPVTLIKKKSKTNVSMKLIRMTAKISQSEKTILKLGQRQSECLQLQIGAAQGSAYSPKKGIMYSDEGARKVQENKFGTPKLGRFHVPILMYADDAILFGKKKSVLEDKWKIYEKQSEMDGTNVNYEKSDVHVLRHRLAKGSLKWQLRCKHGVKKEKDQSHFKYLGFIVDGDSYKKHVEAIAGKLELASLLQFQKFKTLKETSLRLRKEFYLATIRGSARYGMEIWGVQDDRVLDQTEYKCLRMWMDSTRRPRAEMLQLYWKLLPLNLVALDASFCHSLKMLPDGDVLEKESIEV